MGGGCGEGPLCKPSVALARVDKSHYPPRVCEIIRRPTHLLLRSFSLTSLLQDITAFSTEGLLNAIFDARVQALRILACGADLWCNGHCTTSPADLEWFWGKVWPKIGRKSARKFPARLPSAFRYPKHRFVGEQIRNPHQPQIGNRDADEVETRRARSRYGQIRRCTDQCRAWQTASQYVMRWQGHLGS